VVKFEENSKIWSSFNLDKSGNIVFSP